jgi:DDE family transposase
VADAAGLRVSKARKVLAMTLTPGSVGTSPQFIAVLRKTRVARISGGHPRTRPALVLADKAYTSKGDRAHLRSRGIKACIPSKADQDANRRKRGSKGGRHPRPTRSPTANAMPSSAASTASNATAVVATRYDKSAVRYQAVLTVTVISEWLRLHS